LDDKVKEDEMGGTMHTIFWSEKVKGRDHVEDLGVEGRIILEPILGK
jgi:hypothetical protein